METPRLVLTTPKPDWSHSAPDDLEASIARTREKLQRHLELLKHKLDPQAKLRRVALPFAAIAAAAGIGALAWKLSGGRERHRREPG